MADTSKPLSVIIIGCGRVAVKHLKAISKLKGLKLAAVVDTMRIRQSVSLAQLKVLQILPSFPITKKPSIR